MSRHLFSLVFLRFIETSKNSLAFKWLTTSNECRKSANINGNKKSSLFMGDHLFQPFKSKSAWLFTID